MDHLNDERKAILDEFRKRTSDLQLPEQGDGYLLRWLRARCFDIDKSEEMLRNHIDWRKAWAVDELTDDWEPPAVLKKYHPMEFIGFDKSGRPVWFGRHAQFDIRGILMSVSARELLRYYIWQNERSMRMMKRQTELLQKEITTHVIVSDMADYKIKYMMYRPGHELGGKFTQMYEANYPETLAVMMVLNTAPIIHVFFKIVKPFLSEDTLSKIQFYGTRNEWEAALKDIIPEDILPKKWGGTRVDSTGDEACSEIVGAVGDIPKEYYLSNRQTDDLAGCPTVRVVNGRKFVITKTVSQQNSIISWKFRSLGGDIAFGIKKIMPTGKPQEVLAKTRVMAHEYVEEGQLLVDTGEYNIEFDNSFSYFTSKMITFSIEVETLDELRNDVHFT